MLNVKTGQGDKIMAVAVGKTQMDELIGQKVGQYRVDALLGEGNMGAVYQAYDMNLTRKVVLKVMHRQLANHESFQKRFMQEAQAAARLDHPSIVKIFNFDTVPTLYMVMEYVSGPSLGEYVRHQQAKNEIVNLDTALRLIAQVADALDYAHSQGVVHRDVKPSNVLLKPLKRPDREGDPALRVIVTDFGLAKLLEGGMKTMTGTFMGTLSYMSPEQCLGRDLDGRSDIYSLGIVLYQFATGRLPFNVKSPTDAIRMHVKELPPAPRLVRPGLPEMVEQVILQAIAKNPASRFQTGNQFAEALRMAAAALVSPGDTSTFSLIASEGGTNILKDGIVPSQKDQMLIYHAAEAPRIMPMTQAKITIGRGQDSDVMLPDKGVSRHHAMIERIEDAWHLIDLESTNGIFLEKIRLTPNVPENWPPQTELRIGPYSMQWQKGQPSTTGITPLEIGSDSYSADNERPPQTNSGEIEIVVDPASSTLEAGNRLNLQVMLINRGPIVEHVNIRLDQLPDNWMTFSENLVKLMPGGRGFIRVTLEPPRDSSAKSGDHAFEIIATPMSNPEAFVKASCILTIRPFTDHTVELTPKQLQGDESCRVSVTNQGNENIRYTIRSYKEHSDLQIEPNESVMTIDAGRTQTVDLRINAKKRPLLGAVKRQPFYIEIASAEKSLELLQGELEIHPTIPLWVLYSIIIISVTIGAFAFLWYLLSTSLVR